MKKNNKGFTLAELLIVVAIIAVLIAIGMPVFSAALERSREAVDAANIRSGYAEAMQAIVTADNPKDEDAAFYSDTQYKFKQTDITNPAASGTSPQGWTISVDWPDNMYADSGLSTKGVNLNAAYDGTDKIKSGDEYYVKVQYVNDETNNKDGYVVSLSKTNS